MILSTAVSSAASDDPSRAVPSLAVVSVEELSGVKSVSGFRWDEASKRDCPARLRGSVWRCSRVNTSKARVSYLGTEKEVRVRSTRAMRLAGSTQTEGSTTSGTTFVDSSLASEGASLEFRGETHSSISDPISRLMKSDATTLLRTLRSGLELDYQNAHCCGNDYLLKDSRRNSHLVVMMTSANQSQANMTIVHDSTVGCTIQSFLSGRGVSHFVFRNAAISTFAISANRKRGVPGLMAGRALNFRNPRAAQSKVLCHGLISVIWVSDELRNWIRDERDLSSSRTRFTQLPEKLRCLELGHQGCLNWESSCILRTILAEIRDSRLMYGEFGKSWLIAQSQSTASQVTASKQGSCLGSQLKRANVFDAHAVCCNAALVTKKLPDLPKTGLVIIVSKRHNTVWGVMRPNLPETLMTRYDIFEIQAKFSFARLESPSMVWLSYTNDGHLGDPSESVDFEHQAAIRDKTVSKIAIEGAKPWSGLPWSLSLPEVEVETMRRTFRRRREGADDE